MSESEDASTSKAMLWGGRVMSYLPAAMLLLDAGMKFAKPEVVVKGTVELGFPESSIVPMGAALLVSTLLYMIPRTSVLGAILLTGYLGGAVCTHVRAGHPPFNIVFPAIFGAILWGGLWLRDARLRALLPLKS